MPQVSFCLGSPAVTTCCSVFECFVEFSVHCTVGLVWCLASWALFWWPRFGVLWLPWGSPLACSPQPWAETRWRRVRLPWLFAAVGAPPGPRGGRCPSNLRFFRQPVQYIKNTRQVNRLQKLRSISLGSSVALHIHGRQRYSSAEATWSRGPWVWNRCGLLGRHVVESASHFATQRTSWEAARLGFLEVIRLAKYLSAAKVDE